jgi:CheY-like chemotaxis protein
MLGIASKRPRPNLLLVDDDLISREVLATVLTMGGFAVQTAEDGRAAIAQLSAATFTPEVILIDTRMPGLSGVPLIAEIRIRSQAKIIAISASQPPQEIVSAADGFLLKPFGPADLDNFLADTFPAARPSDAGSTESQPESTQPVVNPETLVQLRQMMPEASVRQIYAAVVADLFLRLPELEAALSRRDAAEISRIGHALKGGCGMAGALEAAHIGAELEALGKHPPRSGVNHLDNGARLLDDLRRAAASLKRMLEADFPAQGQGSRNGGSTDSNYSGG